MRGFLVVVAFLACLAVARAARVDDCITTESSFFGTDYKDPFPEDVLLKLAMTPALAGGKKCCIDITLLVYTINSKFTDWQASQTTDPFVVKWNEAEPACGASAITTAQFDALVTALNAATHLDEQGRADRPGFLANADEIKRAMTLSPPRTGPESGFKTEKEVLLKVIGFGKQLLTIFTGTGKTEIEREVAGQEVLGKLYALFSDMDKKKRDNYFAEPLYHVSAGADGKLALEQAHAYKTWGIFLEKLVTGRLAHNCMGTARSIIWAFATHYLEKEHGSYCANDGDCVCDGVLQCSPGHPRAKGRQCVSNKCQAFPRSKDDMTKPKTTTPTTSAKGAKEAPNFLQLRQHLRATKRF